MGRLQRIYIQPHGFCKVPFVKFGPANQENIGDIHTESYATFYFDSHILLLRSEHNLRTYINKRWINCTWIEWGEGYKNDVKLASSVTLQFLIWQVQSQGEAMCSIARFFPQPNLSISTAGFHPEKKTFSPEYTKLFQLHKCPFFIWNCLGNKICDARTLRIPKGRHFKAAHVLFPKERRKALHATQLQVHISQVDKY